VADLTIVPERPRALDRESDWQKERDRERERERHSEREREKGPRAALSRRDF